MQTIIAIIAAAVRSLNKLREKENRLMKNSVFVITLTDSMTSMIVAEVVDAIAAKK